MEVIVTVFKRPNMFEVDKHILNKLGFSLLEELFTNPNFKAEGKTAKWYYPERFLNMVEQRKLIARAEKAGFSKIEIVTHSLFIVQTAKNTDVEIVLDKEIFEDSSDFKLSNDIVI